MKLKLLVMMIAVGALALVGGFADTGTAEAAGPTCAGTGVPNMAMTKADTHKHRFGKLAWVRAEWYGVSAAKHYRMEVTPQGGGGTRSDTDTPSYSGGRSMDTVRIGYWNHKKAHDVRVLALDRDGDTIACGWKAGRVWGQ